MAVLARRWPISVAGAVLTAAAVATVARFAPPSYAADGTLLILPPPTAEQAQTSGPPNPKVPTTLANPYLEYGKLDIVGQVLATKMFGDDAAAEVARRGGTGKFAVAMAPSAAPIVRIDIQAPSPGQALATYQAAQTVAEERLAAMQHDEGAPDPISVRLSPINEPTHADKDLGATVRAMIIVPGTASTISSAFAVESRSQYRAALTARRTALTSR
jgi:hypothetical protein